MTLNDWQKAGWLTAHRPSADETARLLALVERDLASCLTPGLDSDWRFSIAYNACLQCAVAALAAEGYRAGREAHHYRVLQSLTFTLGLEPEVVRILDSFRKKRNLCDYELTGLISEKELAEVVGMAQSLRDRLKTWLLERHPDLHSPDPRRL
jgi:hypothetical protein